MFCGKRRKLEFWTYISQLTTWDCGIDANKHDRVLHKLSYSIIWLIYERLSITPLRKSLCGILKCGRFPNEPRDFFKMMINRHYIEPF